MVGDFPNREEHTSRLCCPFAPVWVLWAECGCHARALGLALGHVPPREVVVHRVAEGPRGAAREDVPRETRGEVARPPALLALLALGAAACLDWGVPLGVQEP